LVEKCRHHRVDIGLYRPVPETQNDAAPIEQEVTLLLSSRQICCSDALNCAVSCERHSDIKDIAEHGEDHRHLITNLIDDQAEQNDAYAERPDTGALQLSHVNFGQVKVRRKAHATQVHAAKKCV